MIAAGARIHETALVEGGVAIGEGTSVWDSRAHPRAGHHDR